MNDTSKSLSPPPNKEATIMIDTKDMSATVTHGFNKQSKANNNIGKPPKKTSNGNKAYVSSKIVDALVNMKKHTEELNIKRTLHKERLNSMPKAKVIDETQALLHQNSKDEVEIDEDDEDCEYSEYQSQYYDD